MKKTSILLMAVAVLTLSCKDNERNTDDDDLMQTEEETMTEIENRRRKT
jgi:hypothetical protein